jgi:hypothetical protein
MYYAQRLNGTDHIMHFLKAAFLVGWQWKLAIGAGGVLILDALRDIIAVDAPILVAILLFIVIDNVTGWVGSLRRGQPTTSAAMKSTVYKSFVYLAVVLMAMVIANVFAGRVVVGVVAAGFSQWVAFFILLTEMKSIDENLDKLFGFSAWRFVRAALKRDSPDVLDVVDPKQE